MPIGVTVKQDFIKQGENAILKNDGILAKKTSQEDTQSPADLGHDYLKPGEVVFRKRP